MARLQPAWLLLATIAAIALGIALAVLLYQAAAAPA
jgi:hypothetical protein